MKKNKLREIINKIIKEIIKEDKLNEVDIDKKPDSGEVTWKKSEEIWDGLIHNFRDNKITSLEHLNKHYRRYAVMAIMRKLMD